MKCSPKNENKIKSIKLKQYSIQYLTRLQSQS
jgi:hypothetical protein